MATSGASLVAACVSVSWLFRLETRTGGAIGCLSWNSSLISLNFSADRRFCSTRAEFERFWTSCLTCAIKPSSFIDNADKTSVLCRSISAFRVFAISSLLLMTWLLPFSINSLPASRMCNSKSRAHDLIFRRTASSSTSLSLSASPYNLSRMSKAEFALILSAILS